MPGLLRNGKRTIMAEVEPARGKLVEREAIKSERSWARPYSFKL